MKITMYAVIRRDGTIARDDFETRWGADAWRERHCWDGCVMSYFEHF